jgi:predicted GNAT family acetyltransferase
VSSAAPGPDLRAPAGPVEELDDADLADLRRLVEADPLVNVVLAARLEQIGTLAPNRLGGAVVGTAGPDGRLNAAAFNGGNLMPLGGTPAALREIGAHLVAQRRICSSIVGRCDAVAALWQVLQPAWGPARTVRARQPLLRLDAAPPEIETHFPPVRAMTSDQLDAYLPAATAMFREELDLPPLSGPAATNYRLRVAGLIRRGRAFGVVDSSGEVLFKADIGSVSRQATQIQGVWTRPDLRGQGLAAGALPGVLRAALELAPTVSLYVNDFNVPARRLYERLGMREVAALTTILF